MKKKKKQALQDLCPNLKGREKMVSALSCCALEPDDSARCGICLYQGEQHCMQNFRRDIAALIGAELKPAEWETTPRLLTLDEALYMGSRENYCWLEFKEGYQPLALARVTRSSKLNYVELYAPFYCRSGRYLLRDFGSFWRMWSAKPTEEQMKAMPWEDEQSEEANNG